MTNAQCPTRCTWSARGWSHNIGSYSLCQRPCCSFINMITFHNTFHTLAELAAGASQQACFERHQQPPTAVALHTCPYSACTSTNLLGSQESIAVADCECTCMHCNKRGDGHALERYTAPAWSGRGMQASKYRDYDYAHATDSSGISALILCHLAHILSVF